MTWWIWMVNEVALATAMMVFFLSAFLQKMALMMVVHARA